jgi:hypothetical protein
MESVLTPALLETLIHRELLDFDDDLRCSVTFSTENLYVCLTCGIVFSGGSPLHSHFLATVHSIFLRTSDVSFVALPDFAPLPPLPELDAIRFTAHPRFESALLSLAVRRMATTRTGLYGLSALFPCPGRLSALRLLASIDPVRDSLVLGEFSRPLCSAFSWFFKRLFNPFHFRESVSPAKVLRQLPESDDPFVILCAALNGLSGELGEPNAVAQAVRSTLRIGDAVVGNAKESRVWMLPLELNDSPLYRSGIEKEQLIPNVRIEVLLSRFDGETVITENRGGAVARKTFAIARAAPFLILNLNRIRKTEFSVEKSNVHVVLHERFAFAEKEWRIKAMIAHEGDAATGAHLAFVRNPANGRWFRCRGAEVGEVLFDVAATAQCCFILLETCDAGG